MFAGKAGKIQGVVAAAIPDTEHRPVAGAPEAVDLTAGVGVEPINSVVIAGPRIGPVQALDSGNIVDHSGGGGLPVKVMPGLFAFRPIAHDTAGLGVLCVIGVTLVRATAVVTAGMFQPQGVPELMGQQEQKMTAYLWVTSSAPRAHISRYPRLVLIGQRGHARTSRHAPDRDETVSRISIFDKSNIGNIGIRL